MSLHQTLEGNSALFAGLTVAAISVGAIVEIVPMFNVSTGPEQLEGIEPYTPLEVAGRDIYIREGCYVCHSQWIRPFRSETLRYGEWSRAGEYKWDHPFQLGSRRTGPDLARVGGKYPDSWHYDHMRDPREITPASIMPSYSWLHTSKVDPADIQASMRALATVGLPYTDADIQGAPDAMKKQGEEIVERLKGANINAAPDDEIIALIAYLQNLGVDGKKAIADREKAKAAGGAP